MLLPIFLQKNILQGMSLFYGTTDVPVLDFWWHLPRVLKPGWIPHLHASAPVYNGFFRFTSGTTTADLLTGSQAFFNPHTCIYKHL